MMMMLVPDNMQDSSLPMKEKLKEESTKTSMI